MYRYYSRLLPRYQRYMDIVLKDMGRCQITAQHNQHYLIAIDGSSSDTNGQPKDVNILHPHFGLIMRRLIPLLYIFSSRWRRLPLIRQSHKIWNQTSSCKFYFPPIKLVWLINTTKIYLMRIFSTQRESNAEFALYWTTREYHIDIMLVYHATITYPFPNINGATVEVGERISYFIPHSTGYVITYPCWEWS